MPDDIPYCGVPPLPGSTSWNLDPLLLLILAALLVFRTWFPQGRGMMQRTAFLLGWGTLALALVSPLCNLSVALFSARVGQHILLALVAAPLLGLGLDLKARGLGLPALAFGLAIWGWHLPGPYAATFNGDGTAYWAMHVTTIGAALWLWAALLGRALDRPDLAALVALVTAVHMGVLGALLTLAPRPLYAPHAKGAVTLPWGLTALEDQQLGGLLMWVPGGLLFAGVVVIALGLALRRGDPGRALVPQTSHRIE
jgi:putative membrane protein